MGNTAVKRSKSSDSIPDSVHPFDCVPKNNNSITDENDIKDCVNNFVDGKLILTRNYTPQYEQFNKKNFLMNDLDVNKQSSSTTGNTPKERMNVQYNSIFEEIKKKYIPNSEQKQIDITFVYDENDTIVEMINDKQQKCSEQKGNNEKSNSEKSVSEKSISEKKKTFNKLKRSKPFEIKVYKPKPIYAIDNSYTSESSSTESSKRNSINQNNYTFDNTFNDTINDSDDKIINEKGSEQNDVSCTEKREMKISVLEKYRFYNTKKYLKGPRDELQLDNYNQSGREMNESCDSSLFTYPLKKREEDFTEDHEIEQEKQKESTEELPLSIIDILHESKKIQTSIGSKKRKRSVDDLIDKPITESSSSEELWYTPNDEDTLISESTMKTIGQLNEYMVRLKKLYIDISDEQPENFILLKDIENIINKIMESIKDLTTLL